ncbi:MAG: c-type cytochrome [Isosphaeraceae bacterium]
MRIRLNPRVLAIVVALGRSSAADGQHYAQKPEVMPSKSAGSKAVEAEKPEPIPIDGGPAPRWIWGAKDNQAYVLKATFDGGSKAARLKASGDNHVTLLLNGKRIGASDQWEEPLDLDVQQHILPGKNELVAEVRNAGGIAGFVLKLALVDGDGKARYVVTDESWKAGDRREAEASTPARVIGTLGMAPWGNVFDRPSNPNRGVFETRPGFRVERVFTVPREELGSWVAIAFDDKGRLIASDQGDKGLSRITPPPIDGSGETKVEQLKARISSAQGLLSAFGGLYVSVNGGQGSGLYRLRDTDGDDQYDEVVKLKALRGAGEHGPHGLRLSPDGQSIVIVSGNHTLPPEGFQASRLPSNWAEDLLLPRQWDANGHAVGILAPGGWIAKTDPDGKSWEILSAGYRNSYDFAFNADGELFAYDSDMEWDMGMPWYRPTRAVHATSGSEFGWRSGTGKWPTYYPDSLPPMTEIGPGSPVGVTFGYGAKFPAKYQKALYLCDWTFGTIYALHLEPDGSTYKATKEEFLSRTPLPLTDAAVGPDGALYFTIGGRGTQSELFRVTYVGDESTAPADLKSPGDAAPRDLRHQLEAFHVKAADPARAVAFAYPYLKHDDRFIRYAARVALEHQPPALWQDRVLAETDPEALILGTIALAHQGDKALGARLVESLGRLEVEKLPEARQLGWLRALSLVLIRMGPDPSVASKLLPTLERSYPSASDPLNRELCNVLVFLKSPTVVAKTLALMEKPGEAKREAMDDLIARNPGYGGPVAQMLASRPDAQKLHYAFALRNVKDGWSLPQRKAYFQWLADARKRWSGGASFQGFLRNIDNDAFANATDAERLAIEATGARQPYQPKALPQPAGPGQAWTVDSVMEQVNAGLKGRNFKNGEKSFASARCIVCHRFGPEGGATGPDLTQVAGRFGPKDLAEAIVEPSKVVSDQYRASILALDSGQVVTGRVVSESDRALLVVTDPEDPTKVSEIARGSIEEMKPSPVSLMPEKLLNGLNRDEVLDLFAYLLSRGNANDPMFRK